MLHLDSYMLITLLSSVAVLVMGVCLGVVSVPREAAMKNYRVSRRFLAAAYIILAATGQWEVFGNMEAEEGLSLLALTVIAASFQSLLFTLSIITLINMGFMTRRVVWSNLIPVTFLSAVLLVFLVTASQPTFYKALYIALGLYCMQLVIYITMFSSQYRIYRRKLDNFFSANEERRAAWIRQSFYMAACVGVVAVGALFIDKTLYSVFTVMYTVFYIYFGIKYINYVTLFHRIAPIVAPAPEEPDTHTYADVAPLLDGWLAAKRFLCSDITLDTLADEINTNRSYLSRHINSAYGQNFRSWINSLRIGESIRLIEAHGDLSLTEIAERIGISSPSTFYRQFVADVGMTPTDYRRRLGSEKSEAENQ